MRIACDSSLKSGNRKPVDVSTSLNLKGKSSGRSIVSQSTEGYFYFPLDPNEDDIDYLYQQAGFFAQARRTKESTAEMFQLMKTINNIFTKVHDFAVSDTDKDMVDGLVSRAESLLIFGIQLATYDNIGDIVLASMQYAKTLVKGSVLLRMKNMIEIILTKKTTRGGQIEMVDHKPNLHHQNGKVKDKWQTYVKGNVGKRFASLLNLFVAIGLMPEKADTIMGTEFYNLFDVRMRTRESSSIFDHMANVIDYCVECIYPTLLTGELHYLLDDREAVDNDKRFRNCLDMVGLQATGQFTTLRQKYEMTEVAQIIVYLHETIGHMTSQLPYADPRMKQELNSRLIKLDKMVSDLQASFHDSATRVKPYSILIRGSSSQAKTALTSVLSHVICKINNFPEGEAYSCTINGDDKYQSELKPQHLVVTFDDMGNTRPEHAEGNPLFKLIQFINNVHCSALSAIAEQKGKNDIRVKLLFATTNTQDLHASHFSVNPVSVLRRFDIILHVNVKDECRDTLGNIKSEYAGVAMPNFWNIDIITVGIERVSSLSDKAVFTYRDKMGKAIKSFGHNDLVDVIEYLQRVTPRYYAVQNDIVASSTEMHKQPHCEAHPFFILPCAKCAKMGTQEAVAEAIQQTRENDLIKVDMHSSVEIPPLVLRDPLGHQGGEDEAPTEDVLEPVPANWFDEPVAYDANEGDTWFDAIEDEMNDAEQTVISLEPNIPATLGVQSAKRKKGIKKYYKKLKACFKKRIKVDPQMGDAAENFATFCDRTFTEPNWRPVPQVMDPIDRLLHFSSMRVHALTSIRKRLKALTFEHKIMIAVAGSIGVAVATSAFFNRKKLIPQGANLTKMEQRSMTPTMLNDHKDVYKKTISIPVVPSPASISSTMQSIDGKMDKHLVTALVCEIQLDGTKGPEFNCNALSLGAGKWSLPGHILKPGRKYNIWLLSKTRSVVGVNHTNVIVDDTNVRHDPKLDYCVIRIRKGNNWNSLKYFSEKTQMPKVGDNLVLYHRPVETVKCDDEDDDDFLEMLNYQPSQHKLHVKVKAVEERNVVGGKKQIFVMYDHPTGTFQGLCGCVAVLDGRNPIILGIHTAGKGKEGAITVFSQESVSKLDFDENGDLELKLREDVPLPSEIQGKAVNVLPEIHGRSPVNWLEKNKNGKECVHSLEFRGTVEGTVNSRFKTDIKESCIAPLLKETLGIEKEHAGPDKKAVSYARWKNMDAMSRHKNPVDPTILKYAKDDLLAKMRAFLPHSDLRHAIHPVTKDVALNGLPGVTGYDPININSSVGWPLNKKAWHFLVTKSLDEAGLGSKKIARQVERPDGTFEIHYSIEFDPELYDIDALMEAVLVATKKEERVNIVFKSNLKDEALSLVKVAEGKIRVFAGAPKYLVVLTRMLCMSALVAKKEVPTVFECAVGCDAMGQDWDHIYKYVTKFGEHRVVLGDFKEYDMTAPCEFTVTGMECFKEILAMCDYHDDDLDLYDTVATEICLPFYVVDGAVVQIDGSVPSGHPFTVDLNTLINQLLMRYAYYANHVDLNPGRSLDPVLGVIPLFHMVVALMTYGDDNAMSVSEKEELFNQLTVTYQLAKIGVVYTNADKTKATEPFVKNAMSFLKRNFHMHALMNTRTGALDIKSIEKSLTCTRSATAGRQESDAQVMAANMAAAQYECFLHSVELFEEYTKAFEIVKTAKDYEGFTVADYYDKMKLSLDDCVKRFEAAKSRYAENYIKFQVPLDQQSGCSVLALDPMEIAKERTRSFKTELIRLLGKHRAHRRKMKRCMGQLKQIVTCLKQGEEYLSRFHYSFFTQTYDPSNAMRAYNLLARLHYRRVMQNYASFDRLPREIQNRVLAYAMSEAYLYIHEGTFKSGSDLGHYRKAYIDRWI